LFVSAPIDPFGITWWPMKLGSCEPWYVTFTSIGALHVFARKTA
jgi:hypothetical protein